MRLAMLVISDAAPVPDFDQLRQPNDRAAAAAVAQRIYPRRELVAVEDDDLLNAGWPDRDGLFVGVFGTVTLICTTELYDFFPYRVPRKFLREGDGRTTQLFVVRSYNDYFVYGLWRSGELVREIAAYPDGGARARGEQQEFEAPYWAGQHRQEDYPLPFHPLDFASRALPVQAGIEGELSDPVPGMVSPDEIMLAGFEVRKTAATTPDQSWRTGVTETRSSNAAWLLTQFGERGFDTTPRSPTSLIASTWPDVRVRIGATHVRIERRIEGSWRLETSHLLTTGAADAVASLDRQITR